MADHLKAARSFIRRASKKSSSSLGGSFHANENSNLLPKESNSNGSQKSQVEFARKESGTIAQDLVSYRKMLTGNYINVLLLLAPFALWSHYGQWNDVAVFLLNFFVLIPMANLLGDTTEVLAFHAGETIGGLLNATFGNAVEVVVAILALKEGEVSVVKSSLIGSILSNLLLVLGCSFIAGGLAKKENLFNAVGANANSSMLMLCSFAILLPSYLHYSASASELEEKDEEVLMLSHISAIFLLFMYIQSLFFQLYTHLEYFNAEKNQDDASGGEEEEEETVELSYRGSMIFLVVMTLIVSFFSDYLVSSIDGFTNELGLSKSFVGVILLPIVGNAVEHVTAVKVALNDKMELAMGVAVGSATQVSMFVVPVAVIAGWIMGQSMTLSFPQFEILIYVFSIVIVYAIVADGKSNWLEGSMLLTTYALVAIALIWVHV